MTRKEVACEVLGYCPFDLDVFMTCQDHCGVGVDVIEEEDWSDSDDLLLELRSPNIFEDTDPEYKLHLMQLRIEQEERY